VPLAPAQVLIWWEYCVSCLSCQPPSNLTRAPGSYEAVSVPEARVNSSEPPKCSTTKLMKAATQHPILPASSCMQWHDDRNWYKTRPLPRPWLLRHQIPKLSLQSAISRPTMVWFAEHLDHARKTEKIELSNIRGLSSLLPCCWELTMH
jgi:hypothetical protein